MIIGNGSIAKLLNDREGVMFFASGVSDSSETNEDKYAREHYAIGAALADAKFDRMMFVYFSTISIFTTVTDYTLHKRIVESAIKGLANDYCIIRIGNVWECTNPNTFINKMKYWEREGKLHDSMIRDEYKYMISKEQLNFITDNLPRTGKHEISIFGEMLKVKECLNR